MVIVVEYGTNIRLCAATGRDIWPNKQKALESMLLREDSKLLKDVIDKNNKLLEDGRSRINT